MGYTNSPLVDYVRLSPNNSGERTHSIDTITIHCVVGQLSVESIGSIFAPSSRQASSNYGVGYDGRIGMYVEEKNRSWCSSNRANDQRAITIEVASDTTHPYAVNSAAYEATIKLVADICKRNNIKKLMWKADKSLIGQVDKQNMTAHRWFDAKACPGDYLYERFGDIANRVNQILGSTSDADKPSKDIPPADPGDPKKNSKIIWDMLLASIKNEFGVAGILGNLQAESACMPNNLQNTYEGKLGMNDEQYTRAVDNGSYTNFVNDSAGYGLAQWTFWSLKRNMLAYHQSNNKSIGDLRTQVEFLINQLSKDFKSSVWDVVCNATSIRQASDAMLLNYERPRDQSESVRAKRAQYGQEFYNSYATKEIKPAPAPAPSKVLKFTIGEIVDFHAGLQYVSSNSSSGSTVASSLAKVTAVAGSGKHPYHVRKINDSGAFVAGGVYGWVDESHLTKREAKAEDVVYTVVAGDMLSTIAAKFGTTYQVLAQYNGISNPDKIYVGQKIRIPASASPVTPAQNKKSNEEIAREVIEGKWGNGQVRKNRLISAGYDYDAIQKIVNRML